MTLKTEGDVRPWLVIPSHRRSVTSKTLGKFMRMLCYRQVLIRSQEYWDTAINS